jgi:hypothetical protein
MSELEPTLRGLASDIVWPATPDVAARLELQPRRRLRLAPLVAIALVVLALAVALAVPQARSSILRFFHVGGVAVERVETLPHAASLPLGADLGRAVTERRAEQVLGRPFLFPELAGEHPGLYEREGVVSALLEGPGRVLLSETGYTGLLKKLSAMSTTVELVRIAPDVEGLWLSGGEHVFFGPRLPPRLAGDVFVFERGGVTYRLEGRSLAKPRALALARQILR